MYTTKGMNKLTMIKYLFNDKQLSINTDFEFKEKPRIKIKSDIINITSQFSELQ